MKTSIEFSRQFNVEKCRNQTYIMECIKTEDQTEDMYHLCLKMKNTIHQWNTSPVGGSTQSEIYKKLFGNSKDAFSVENLTFVPVKIETYQNDDIKSAIESMCAWGPKMISSKTKLSSVDQKTRDDIMSRLAKAWDDTISEKNHILMVYSGNQSDLMIDNFQLLKYTPLDASLFSREPNEYESPEETKDYKYLDHMELDNDNLAIKYISITSNKMIQAKSVVAKEIPARSENKMFPIMLGGHPLMLFLQKDSSTDFAIKIVPYFCATSPKPYDRLISPGWSWKYSEALQKGHQMMDTFLEKLGSNLTDEEKCCKTLDFILGMFKNATKDGNKLIYDFVSVDACKFMERKHDHITLEDTLIPVFLNHFEREDELYVDWFDTQKNPLKPTDPSQCVMFLEQYVKVNEMIESNCICLLFRRTEMKTPDTKWTQDEYEVQLVKYESDQIECIIKGRYGELSKERVFYYKEFEAIQNILGK